MTIVTHKHLLAGDQFFGEIILSRPEVANALSPEMIDAITKQIQQFSGDHSCRGLIITAKGKNFCAGADLNWMKASAELTSDQNKHDAERLHHLFAALRNAPYPTITVCQGAVYGGAVGLVCCSDIVIADENTKMSLSEVRLGLIPAVIAPFVAERVGYRQLLRLGLTAKVMLAAESYKLGLIDHVVPTSEKIATTRAQVESLVQGGHHAQRHFKELVDEISRTPASEWQQITVAAIASVRRGKEAQEGLKSFIQGTPATWRLSLPSDWCPEGLKS